ncbi:MocR-like pyridoxine biosynthesis transcription factor PdxR, partial [Rhodospirillum rubrum]|uniref:MocR-like pyridoxine biosynthesis transcription factor PdxR n=1 Tax=Rhodospirillum rubrum TaxID=1085 RepID=UPI0019046F39
LSQWGRRVMSAEPQPAIAAPRRYDFLYGTSNTTLFPHKDWRRAILGVLDRRRCEPAQLLYQDATGSPALRRAVADWLRLHRGIDPGKRGVVITNGSQQGIDLATRLLVDPGAVVAVEEPGYQGFHEILSALGARLLPIAVDEQGLRVDHLEALSREGAVAGVCVTPSHQFPTGAVLSPARRMALLAWAKAEGAWVIEDDYDSEFRYGARPLAALAAGDDEGRVIHLASFSKALFPALRLGMASVPAGLLGPFGAARRLSDRHGPALEQDALARWMEDGTFARHLRRVRTRQAERRAVLVDALTRHFAEMVRIGGASAGLHLVAWFPGFDAAAMAAWADRAAVLGIGVHPITRHYQGPAAAAFVLGYAGIAVDDIPAGISLLKACAPL